MRATIRCLLAAVLIIDALGCVAEREERAIEETKDPEWRWRMAWTIAEIYALLGETEGARNGVTRAGPVPDGTDAGRVLSAEAPALAALGDWDRVAELIRNRSHALFYGICSRPELSPMKADPRYSNLLAYCPQGLSSVQ